MVTTITFEDRPFFLCDLILHEARNVLGMGYHDTPEFISPSSSSRSSEGVSNGPSRYFDDTTPSDVLPTTVCMRDLEYWGPGVSDHRDQETDLLMKELADDLSVLHQIDENLYVRNSHVYHATHPHA